jgi:hypothetical protein
MGERNEKASIMYAGEASKICVTRIITTAQKCDIFINGGIRALGVRTEINLVLVDTGLCKN